MTGIPAVTWLQAEPGPTDFSFFFMLGTIGLIFYFLVFRPQNKKQKELDEMIKSAQKGDEVITTGGLHGKVHAASETTLSIEIASVKGTAVRVDIERSRVERVIRAGSEKEEDDESGKKAKKAGKGDAS